MNLILNFIPQALVAVLVLLGTMQFEQFTFTLHLFANGALERLLGDVIVLLEQLLYLQFCAIVLNEKKMNERWNPMEKG